MSARTVFLPGDLAVPTAPAKASPSIRHIVRSLVSVSSILLLLLSTTGCNLSQKFQLQSQIDDLNGEKQKLLTTAAEQQAQVAALSQQLDVQSAEMDEYKAQVHSYMLGHVMAVAAIVAGVAGTGVALDSNNEFSDDAKGVGAVIAIAAGLWALGNMAEVNEVLQTLNNADAHMRTLQTKFAQTQSAIAQQRDLVQNTRQRISDLSQQTARLQSQLDAL
jgi:peptidoglycan hydrolase CwlO-like protein